MLPPLTPMAMAISSDTRQDRAQSVLERNESTQLLSTMPSVIARRQSWPALMWLWSNQTS